MSIGDSIVVTPKTYKEQILIKLKSLVQNKPGKLYHLPKSVSIGCVDDEGERIANSIQLIDNRLIILSTNATNDDSIQYDALDEIYIEQLWTIYLACSDIYEHKSMDYSKVDGRKK